MSRRRRGHLYRGRSGRASRRRIVRYYEGRGESPARARESYGRIVGKVARERAAEKGGLMRERVRGHYSRRGRHRFRVKGHYAIVHAHRHSRGHHAGRRCPAACRKGMTAHRHTHRKRRR